MSKPDKAVGEITARTEAAYDSVREQLKKTAERADDAIERMKKKLERATERDHEPAPVPR